MEAERSIWKALPAALLGAMMASASARADDPAGRAPLSSADARFLEANIEWVLDHELAHALIHAFDLTVPGQEEDAADAFASASVSARHPEREAAGRLALVAELWFLQAGRTDADGAPDYFSEHDLDTRRGFRVLCVANGADPAVADEALGFVDVPDGGFDGCEVDRDLATESWDVLIGPNTLYDDEPPADVSVEYRPAGGLDAERAALEATGALETLAEEAASAYALFDPLAIVADACGEADAGFDPDKGEIVVCYEFVADMLALHATAGAAGDGQASDEGAADDAGTNGDAADEDAAGEDATDEEGAGEDAPR